MDSGVRSGLEVVRALALGAKGVMIGRPWVYALAAAQKRGVADLLNSFANEMRVAMALSGCTKIEDLHRGMLEF
jgi:L-lactate dehydrogenase (cytochrome)